MKKKQRNKGDESKLEMSSMIDVVFQLLIFFVVTLKQDDIFSQLEALRPAPDPSISKPQANDPITIVIGRGGFYFGGKPMTENQLVFSFKQIARTNREAMVMVKCNSDSPHGYLVRALDVLSQVGLHKVSVFSM